MNKVRVDGRWEKRGRTVRELIAELETFDNQDLPVEISIDGGATRSPISLVGKDRGTALLISIVLPDVRPAPM